MSFRVRQIKQRRPHYTLAGLENQDMRDAGPIPMRVRRAVQVGDILHGHGVSRYKHGEHFYRFIEDEKVPRMSDWCTASGAWFDSTARY